MKIVRKLARKNAVRTGVVTAAAGVAVFGIGGVAQAHDSGAETGGVESSALPEPRDGDAQDAEGTAPEGTATEDAAAEDAAADKSAPSEAATREDTAPDDAAAREDTVREDTTREDTAPKVIEGECDSTLKGRGGQPLTVDVGAAASAEGIAGIGTESGTEGTLVSLPLKETLAATGVSESGVVVDSLGQVCDTAQGTVNALGGTTRSVTDGLTPDEPGDPDQPGDPQPDPAPDPEQPAPGEGGEGAPGPDVPPALDAPAPPPIDQGVLVEPLSPVALPPAADLTVPKAPVGPGMDVPNKGSEPGAQENTTRKSGTARALPQAAETDRLPLALSVGALLVVVAGLSRAWIARKNA